MDTAEACYGTHVKNMPRKERVTRKHVLELLETPLPELLRMAQEAHRAHFNPREIRASTLVSIKTGACTEDCAYCAQSARHGQPVPYEPLMKVEEVLEAGRKAKEAGATRLCMGAAWRGPKDGPQFDSVLEMVRGVKALGLEACVTLGMLDDDQARRLKEAGLDFYNHNLDTSPEYYSKIITTRTYQDRLDTIARVRAAGIKVCSGGILGMGESREDRAGLLHELANLPVPPDSVPINKLMPMPGTPLSEATPVDDIEIVRAIAATRVLLPSTQIRLSAGRSSMPHAMQFLCFLAGANGIFFGDQLLTAENPSRNEDRAMIDSFGMILVSED